MTVTAFTYFSRRHLSDFGSVQPFKCQQGQIGNRSLGKSSWSYLSWPLYKKSKSGDFARCHTWKDMYNQGIFGHLTGNHKQGWHSMRSHDTTWTWRMARLKVNCGWLSFGPLVCTCPPAHHTICCRTCPPAHRPICQYQMRACATICVMHAVTDLDHPISTSRMHDNCIAMEMQVQLSTSFVWDLSFFHGKPDSSKIWHLASHIC